MRLILLSLMSLNSFAFVASVSGLATWFYHGQSQYIFLDQQYANTYKDYTHTQVLASAEVFLGLNFPINQLGLAFESTSPVQIAGNVWETGDALFNNFNYTYSLRHQFLSIKNIFIWPDKNLNYLPYFSFNLGLAWNESYGFTTHALIPEAYQTSEFANQMKLSFAYKLGLGLRKNINQHWQTHLGYEFADWGHSSLGLAPGQSMNHGPSLNHSYVNQIAIGLTYNT